MIRYPNITGNTDREQIKQLRTYLYQLVDQLNVSGIGTAQPQPTAVTKATARSSAAAKAAAEEQARSNFNDIKTLIIKSADIVDAFSEVIIKKLEGRYVAEATFPEGSAKFVNDTSATINANSERIGTTFDNTQTIQSNINSINDALKTDESGTKILGASAWVNIGLIGYDKSTGFPIYGMEIGQMNKDNGEEVYSRFAQYLSDGVHLFDQNSTEVVELSSAKMIIKTNATFHGNISQGSFTDYLRADGSIATKWTGGV